MLGAGLIGLLIVFGLVGGVLLITGLVGRRVQTPPSCWRCRFDVSGDENIRNSRFPVTCPECGLELRGPGYIRLRARRSLRPLWLSGLALCGLAMAGMVSIGVATGGSMNLLTVASTPQLFTLADTGSHRAFVEIQARAADSRLNDEDWGEIYTRVQATIDGDSSQDIYSYRGWIDWSQFYPDLVGRGDIDADEARAMAESRIELSAATPSDLAAGDPLPFRINARVESLFDTGYRGYSTPSFDLEVIAVRLNGREIYTNDAPLVAPESDYDWEDEATALHWTWEGAEELPVVSGAVEGDNVFEYDVRLAGAVGGWGDDSVISQLLTPGAIVGPLGFTVTETRPVSLQPDAGLGSAAPAGWVPEQTIAASLSHGCSCGTSPGIEFEVADAYLLPANSALYYDVYLECAGEEWFIGTKRFNEDSRSTEMLIDSDQADKIEANGGAALTLEPSSWNARLYYERPTVVIEGDPIERWIVFKDEEDDNENK